MPGARWGPSSAPEAPPSVVNFRKRRLAEGGFDFGNSIWYVGEGGQAKMKQHANTLGAPAHLVSPCLFWRMF